MSAPYDHDDDELPPVIGERYRDLLDAIHRRADEDSVDEGRE